MAQAEQSRSPQEEEAEDEGDTEFKVVDGEVVMKPARPYPGWNSGG